MDMLAGLIVGLIIGFIGALWLVAKGIVIVKRNGKDVRQDW